MRGRARSCWRAIQLVAWTGGCALGAAAGGWRWRRDPGRRWRSRRRWTRRWGRGCWSILGMRVTVDGEPPRPPFLLVTNHLSWVDILLLAGAAPAVFVAKAELAAWPFVGTICRSVGTIFVVRESRRDVVRVNEAIERAVESGAGVVLFAEGTSSSGARVAPLRPSLLDYPARAGRAVHVAALSYATPAGAPPAHLAVCWWGGMSFLPHVLALLRLPEFTASLRFGGEPVRESERKMLASRLHAAVSARFEPVHEEPIACLPARS